MHNSLVAHINQWKTHSRGYVPHIENMSLQVITYRLYDSLPANVVDEMKIQLAIKEKTESDKNKLAELRKTIDRYEDAGYGQCFLKDARVADVVQENMLHFDEKRYKLICWCIMPNHVHVLIGVKDGYTLSEIMHGWRSYTAHECNRILNRSGDFWMNEYFDRYIRNQEHLSNVINYIAQNPVKAGLVKPPEDWPYWGCRRAACAPRLEA